MAISTRTKQILGTALCDATATNELVAHMGVGTVGTAITAFTITPTSGTLPTANSALTVADTTTPTVVELLEGIVELNAKVNAIRAALTAYGVTL